MRLDQALAVMNMVKEELFNRHGVLSIKIDLSGIRVHLFNKDLFESFPVEAVLIFTDSGDGPGCFDHFEKNIDNVTYQCLYEKVACPSSMEQAAGWGEGSNLYDYILPRKEVKDHEAHLRESLRYR